MVERKLFKTKLCVLYKRGHCPRQSCSFAHGEAELRRFSSSSFRGRHDYRGSDLRFKLERRHYSPLRRYSPRRETRRHAFYERGYSPSKSFDRSDRRHRKRQHLDGHSDYSGSLKISEEGEDLDRDVKNTSDSRDVLEEQLKQVQIDVEKLEDNKFQLQIFLDERTQEADSLTSKILELESQFYREKEECKRISSKMKKFIRAYNRHSRMQDDLKRSHARIQKLGDQLGSDVFRPAINGDDSSLNIVSDGEHKDIHHGASTRTDVFNSEYPERKRVRIKTGGAFEELKSGLGRFEKSELGLHRVNDNNKDAEFFVSGSNGRMHLVFEGQHNHGKNGSGEKVKEAQAVAIPPPSTSMAAHAQDDYDLDAVIEEEEERPERRAEARKRAEKGAVATGGEISCWPHKGDAQNIEDEGNEEEMADVDIV